nr:AraC family transcriptional regulator [Paenibacillus mangrovi]
MWSYVFEVGTLICERSRYSNTSSAVAIGGQLLVYVNENYTSADISLKQLAELFKMSMSSVSKIFKEVSGINFYDYVCRLRMEMAKELLREKKCGMDDIARQVGYHNLYSFKRAFTRYEGIKPDKYVDLA